MNYHNILNCDMLNGQGLRVVLFVSGCNHHCKDCQNPETWDYNSGIPFDDKAKQELIEDLSKDYISGLTLSGGDPMNEHNIEAILDLVKDVKKAYPKKNIWIYTGYTLDELLNPLISTDTEKHQFDIRKEILKYCDVLVDGKFEIDKLDASYEWAGSTNQKIIDLNILKTE